MRLEPAEGARGEQGQRESAVAVGGSEVMGRWPDAGAEEYEVRPDVLQ